MPSAAIEPIFQKQYAKMSTRYWTITYYHNTCDINRSSKHFVQQRVSDNLLKIGTYAVANIGWLLILLY